MISAKWENEVMSGNATGERQRTIIYSATFKGASCKFWAFLKRNNISISKVRKV